MSLDLETVAGIFSGEIISWIDPAILATSPQVGAWFNAHPQVSTAFTPVVCCSNPTQQQSAGVLLLQSLNTTKVAQTDAFKKYFTLPVSWTEQLKPSDSMFQLLESESRMTARSSTLQTMGQSTISYRMISTATTDPTSEFRIVQQKSDVGMTEPASIGGDPTSDSSISATMESIAAEPGNFIACARQGFLHDGLTDPKWAPGPITGCYPLASPLSFGIGLAFEGNRCTRGNHSLNYFQWINTNLALSGAALTSGILRMSDLPEIQKLITTTLNTATCDGQTLLITLPKVWTVNTAITGFGIAAMVILLVTFVTSAIILAIYRHRTVLRSSSVPFLGLILGGLSLLAISISLWSAPTVDSTHCGSFMWLASIGFSLVFVPFFAKTWRIYLIFSRQKLQVVKMSNKRLMIIVCAFFLAELIVMLAWSQVSPLKPVTYYRNISGTIHQATHCSVDSDGMIFVVIEAVYKGALLLTGSLIAFRTRKVTSSFNESSSIALSIYSCLFSSVILGALIYFVSAFEDTLILLLLFLIFWLATVTWALLFGSKFYALFTQTEADAALASKIDSMQTEKSQGGFSFVSVIAMPLPMLKSYVQALESQLIKARKQLTAALGGTANEMVVPKATTASNVKRSMQINPPISKGSSGEYGIPGEANRPGYSSSSFGTLEGGRTSPIGGEEPDVLKQLPPRTPPAGVTAHLLRHDAGGSTVSAVAPSAVRIHSPSPRSPSMTTRTYQPLFAPNRSSSQGASTSTASSPSTPVSRANGVTLSTYVSSSADATTNVVSPTHAGSTSSDGMTDEFLSRGPKTPPHPHVSGPAASSTMVVQDMLAPSADDASRGTVEVELVPFMDGASSSSPSESPGKRITPPQSTALRPSSRAQPQGQTTAAGRTSPQGRTATLLARSHSTPEKE